MERQWWEKISKLPVQARVQLASGSDISPAKPLILTRKMWINLQILVSDLCSEFKMLPFYGLSKSIFD